jgi:chromate transporter
VAERGAPGLATIVREWGRIGCVGFGGPLAHVALLRQLCVERRGWMEAEQFEHAIAVTQLLPGPASTQLAIYCAWRLRGLAGALAGGGAFIAPGLVLIVALAALFLGSPPRWVQGVGAGAGAVVAAVALQAGLRLVPGSWARAGEPVAADGGAGRAAAGGPAGAAGGGRAAAGEPPATGRALGGARARWLVYLVAGGAAAATLGPWLVVVLVGCGLVELAWRRGLRPPGGAGAWLPWPVPLATAAAAGLGALCWTALKVGALSYGGGFVIVPLMQADAVSHYHWMTDGQFAGAVALGQATPGPVVLTVAVVGYAAAGVGGALLAALVAFSPSFLFVALGARRFERLRTSPAPRAFLDGAGPAAIGAILGVTIPLARALGEPWQYGVLAAGAVLLLVVRRGVVPTLLAAAVAGAVAALAGAPLPG